MTRSASRLWSALGISVLTAGLCAERAALRGQPQIPLAATGPTGTGVAAGRVVDPISNTPVAGAIVTLIQIEAPRDALTQRQRVMADGEGRFAFIGLPKGRFSLRANLPGYIDGALRQRRPNTSAEPLELADGERRIDLVLPIWKAAVIAGRVVDEAGDPMVGVEVQVLRRIHDGGVARYAASAVQPRYTDDRGSYRFANLPPGQYVVVVASTAISFPLSFMGSDAAVSDEHRDQVFASTSEFSMLGSDRNQQIGDRVLMTSSYQPRPPRPSDDGAVAMYPTTFFPGTPNVTNATIIALDSSGERTDVDLPLVPVRTFRVSGRLMSSEGPVANTSVRLYSAGHAMLESMGGFATATGLTDGTGEFSLIGVPPGQYMLRADRPRRPSSFLPYTGDKPIQSAAEAITVGSADVRGLTVQLRPDVRVSGRVDWQTTTSRARQVANLQITLDRLDNPDGRIQTMTQPDGTFSTFAPAGRYVLRTEDHDDAWLTSVTLAGREILEQGFDVGATAIEGLVFTLSDKTTRLAGAVRDAQNVATSDAVVIAFPVNPDLRTAQGAFPNRMPGVRASRTGAYTIRNLLPGDYFVVAIDAAFADNWQSAESLENLSRLATRISIAANEDRTLDLRMVEVRR